ncbi:Dynein light chain, cytoplasmic [Linum perenne]
MEEPKNHLHDETAGSEGGETNLIITHHRRRRPPPMVIKQAAFNQVKLAAIAVDMNVRLRSSDMPCAMQERAFRCTRSFLDASPDRKRVNPSRLAMALKKEFDGTYGPAWHCIAGKSFGSFVTHANGGFVYFSVDEKLCLLLFKTEVRPVVKPPPARKH